MCIFVIVCDVNRYKKFMYLDIYRYEFIDVILYIMQTFHTNAHISCISCV